MKPKIKFRLERWGNTVLFHIIEMDERFRCSVGAKRSNEFSSPISSIGIDIVSCNGPSLIGNPLGPHDENNVLFLRGSAVEEDNRVCLRVFESAEDAEVYKQKILEALADWAKNWPGFKDDVCEKEPGVYEF